MLLVAKKERVKGKPNMPTRLKSLKPTIMEMSVASGCKPRLVPTSFGSAKFLTTVMIRYNTRIEIPRPKRPVMIEEMPQGISTVPTPRIGKISRKAMKKAHMPLLEIPMMLKPRNSSAKVRAMIVAYEPRILNSLFSQKSEISYKISKYFDMTIEEVFIFEEEDVM